MLTWLVKSTFLKRAWSHSVSLCSTIHGGPDLHNKLQAASLGMPSLGSNVLGEQGAYEAVVKSSLGD